ncbi:MAG: hypothetical protein V1729_04775 [Candidatus Woesearchaeota archaeon]
MYKEFETKTSYKYLKEVIANLKEPICILGGWAVFFHVNRRFQEAQGRPYLGSRDIDLGFHMGDVALKESALAQSIKILTEKLKFKPLSFRLFKEVHTETEEEIQEGQIVPAHFIFPMYVDLIVDHIPADFRKILGFDPIDEPLLRFAFVNKENQLLVKEFDRKLLLPKPELIIAMKMKSLPDRDKEHKKVKDICDIFALLWYSGIEHAEARKKILSFVSEDDIRKCLAKIGKEDLEKASPQLNHSVDELERVLELLR